MPVETTMSSSKGRGVLGARTGAWCAARAGRWRALLCAVVAIALSAPLLLTALGGAVIAGAEERQDSKGPIGWMVCNFLPLGDVLYSAVNTDVVPYELLSKSAGAELERVEDGINALISYGGHDFAETNSQITGYNVSGKDRGDDATDLSFNGGSYQNPYQRFGVSGLSFSVYYGEWKYYKVDACGDGDVHDVKAGVFYQGRLEPKTTYSALDATKDPRSKVYNSATAYKWYLGFVNGFCNGVFLVAKLIVGLTLALIGVSLRDPVEMFGLQGFFTDGHTGIMSLLFNNLYRVFMVPLFIISVGYMAWLWIGKGRTRAGVNVLTRGLGVVLAGAAISLWPSQFLTLPGTAATAIHSLVLKGAEAGFAVDDHICVMNNTDGAAKTTTLKPGADDTDASWLADAGEQVQGIIGCQFWQMFLLKPWSEGQFGVDYNSLWDQESVPVDERAQAEGKASRFTGMETMNQAMTGAPDVPLGDGNFIKNWAVFQVSAQTNAHSLIGKDGVDPLPQFNVQTDWYRVVDALSNYEEEQKQDAVPTFGGQTSNITYMAPKENAVSPYWRAWIGEDMATRFGAASSAALVAALAMAAPAFFAASSSVFSIGLALVASFAPLFLAFGLWQPQGFRILQQWMMLLLRVFVYKLGAGLLLIVDLLLTTGLVRMGGELGWWKMVLLLVVVSAALYRSRERFYGVMLRALSWGGVGAMDSIHGINGRLTRLARGGGRMVGTVGNFAAAGAVGAAVGSRYGRGAGTGLWDGLKEQGRLFVYTRPGLRDAVGVYEEGRASRGDGNVLAGRVCATCGKRLEFQAENTETSIFTGGRLADGNYICEECYNAGLHNGTATFVSMRFNPQMDAWARKREADAQQVKVWNTFQARMRRDRGAFNSKMVRGIVDDFKRIGNGDLNVGDAQSQEMLARYMTAFTAEARSHMDRVVSNGGEEGVASIRVPAELRKYLEQSDVDKAIVGQDYDAVEMLFANAAVRMYSDTTGRSFMAGRAPLDTSNGSSDTIGGRLVEESSKLVLDGKKVSLEDLGRGFADRTGALTPEQEREKLRQSYARRAKRKLGPGDLRDWGGSRRA